MINKLGKPEGNTFNKLDDKLFMDGTTAVKRLRIQSEMLLLPRKELLKAASEKALSSSSFTALLAGLSQYSDEGATLALIEAASKQAYAMDKLEAASILAERDGENVAVFFDRLSGVLDSNSQGQASELGRLKGERGFQLLFLVAKNGDFDRTNYALSELFRQHSNRPVVRELFSKILNQPFKNSKAILESHNRFSDEEIDVSQACFDALSITFSLELLETLERRGKGGLLKELQELNPKIKEHYDSRKRYIEVMFDDDLG